MDNITFISDKTCQICNVNKGSIKIALDYIEAFKYRDTSNNPDWGLNVKRINKYNNGDYKDFIDEYNAHWCCLPKVNQIDYNERIKNKDLKDENRIIELFKNQKKELNKELNNNKCIIEKLKENKDLLQYSNKNLREDIDKLKNENINLRENKDFLKNENITLREKNEEQEKIIKQLLEQLEIKNKSIFEKLF